MKITLSKFKLLFSKYLNRLFKPLIKSLINAEKDVLENKTSTADSKQNGQQENPYSYLKLKKQLSIYYSSNDNDKKQTVELINTLIYWLECFKSSEDASCKEELLDKREESISHFSSWLINHYPDEVLQSHINRINLWAQYADALFIEKPQDSESYDYSKDRDQVANEVFLNIEDTGAEESKLAGRQAYDPIDINTAFINGHLYYPVQTIIGHKTTNELGEKVIEERVETVVVRSDKSVLKALYSSAPKDVSFSDKVLRLSDGTLIEKVPTANPYSTWKWPDIANYIKGEGDVLPFSDCLTLMHKHLQSRVWLPLDEDYWILTLASAASYIQSVFDAVPLLLLTGPAGTGKSETGQAVVEISANSRMIGQTTSASMARTLDETGGLVVIDDLEAVAGKGGNKSKHQFSEMVQMLKVSYKKQTAVKVLTDVKTMKQKKLNLFGIKLINNTAGVDEILGSRMLHVYTRKMPEYLKESFLKREKIDSLVLKEIQKSLHYWSFNNVREVYQTYLSVIGNKTDRSEEIAAPLKVMAKLSGNPFIAESLEIALSEQENRKGDINNPVNLLAKTIENLIGLGFKEVSIFHIQLELRSLAGPGNNDIEDTPWESPEWIGKQLRIHGHSLVGSEFRKRLFGKNLRFVSLDPARVQETRERLADTKGVVIKEKSPTDFCLGCSQCSYNQLDCELMKNRMSKVGV